MSITLFMPQIIFNNHPANPKSDGLIIIQQKFKNLSSLSRTNWTPGIYGLFCDNQKQSLDSAFGEVKRGSHLGISSNRALNTLSALSLPFFLFFLCPFPTQKMTSVNGDERDLTETPNTPLLAFGNILGILCTHTSWDGWQHGLTRMVVFWCHSYKRRGEGWPQGRVVILPAPSLGVARRQGQDEARGTHRNRSCGLYDRCPSIWNHCTGFAPPRTQSIGGGGAEQMLSLVFEQNSS